MAASETALARSLVGYAKAEGEMRDSLNSMKHSDSTEMDRLLRRYARRGGEALRGEETLRGELQANGPVAPELAAGAHMDADEMNAYAEGALPEGARSRYFAHLADCDSCRKLVTDLTLAAARIDEGRARVASLETTPQKSWREWLAAIFSPPVMRYGVPALALFAVIIIAVVATRTRREDLSVAQNTEESRYSAPPVLSDSTSNSAVVEENAATGTAANHSNSNAAPLIEPQKQEQPVAQATPPPTNKPVTETDTTAVSQERAAKSLPAQTGDIKDGSIEFGKGATRERTEMPDAAAAAPPPAPQPTVLAANNAAEAGGRDMREEQKKNKIAGKDDSDELPINGRIPGIAIMKRPQGNEERSDVGRTTTTAGARPSEPATRRGAPATASKSGPRPAEDKAAEKETATETRSVGGHTFQRRGGAWVDKAYSSSRTLTNVARGSEQYRALVADEPGLRAIAEHFSGEVIVAWKTRAYRFY